MIRGIVIKCYLLPHLHVLVEMCRILLLILLVWFVKHHQARKIDDDLVYQHRAAVGQRLSQVRQFLVPLPEDQWDQLLHHLSTLLVPVSAASDMCRNHSLHLLHSFLDQEIWALRMVDASSKIQSGILDGGFHNLGSFSQCTSINEPNMLFRGQHCVIETAGFLPPEISDKISRKPLPLVDVDVIFSLCVPSSCSDQDIITHVDHSLAALGVKSKSYLEQLGLSTDIRQISCSTAEGLPFRTKDHFAMVIFACIVLMALLSTFLKVRSGWLSCFSLSTNFQELMDTRPAPDEVCCLNGIRVLLALPTMACHRALSTLIFPTDRLLTILQTYGSATMAVSEFFKTKTVDTFFLIGGCVLSYSFFLKYHKKNNFDFVDFCLRRYFRVMPVLVAVMLFHGTLLVHSAHGPMWLRNVAELENMCYCNWWAGLVHVSDLLVPHKMCVGESWYISCDFKLQCFAPLLLLLLLRKPRIGLVSISLCFLLSVALTTFPALYFQFSSGYFVGILFGDRFTDLHIPLFYRGVFFRASTFFMGLTLGYLIFYFKQLKTPYSLCKRTAWFGWALCSVTFAGLTAVSFDVLSSNHQFHPLLDPLYVALSRPVFCACSSWIIFACHFGGGGSVNQFLSWPGFRPLARLLYSVYLVHIILQAIQIYSTEGPIIFSYIDETFLYLGDVVASFCVAVVLYTAVEVPFYKLANHIIKGEGRNSKMKNN